MNPDIHYINFLSRDGINYFLQLSSSLELIHNSFLESESNQHQLVAMASVGNPVVKIAGYICYGFRFLTEGEMRPTTPIVLTFIDGGCF